MDFHSQPHQPDDSGDSFFSGESFPPRSEAESHKNNSGSRFGEVALPFPIANADRAARRKDGEGSDPAKRDEGSVPGSDSGAASSHGSVGGSAPRAATPKAPISWREASFASKSEAVCAYMLLKYVPGYQLIPGETFQIPVGSKRIDFKVNGTLIEFHPILIHHEFSSKEAYRNFQDMLGRLGRDDSSFIQSALTREFGDQYIKNRRDLLNCFAATKGTELIVCTSSSAFVRQVIKRFGGPGTPSAAKLLHEFESVYEGLRKQFVNPNVADPEAGKKN